MQKRLYARERQQIEQRGVERVAQRDKQKATNVDSRSILDASTQRHLVRERLDEVVAAQEEERRARREAQARQIGLVHAEEAARHISGLQQWLCTSSCRQPLARRVKGR